MRFEYTSTANVKDSRGKVVKRPILRLEITDKEGNNIETLALIDSGADTTTVNIQLAEILGINFKKEIETIGVGKGKVLAHVGNFPFVIKDLGIRMDVPANYIDSENVGVLLGQEVFFEKFKIKFEKDHDSFELIEIKK